MASVIKAGNATDGVQVTSDNTGILELKTGTGSGTTAMTVGTDQSVTFAGAVSSSGNQTVTGNLTVTGSGSIQGLTVGRGAGAVSTNTAVGASALNANTTGANNTVVGYQAANSTTSSNVTAFGYQAMYGANWATPAFSTAVGYRALYNGGGNNDTAVGYEALANTTSASGANVAVGKSALAATTTGTNNTGIGTLALTVNTTGAQNTALGALALQANTTAVNNTALGWRAGYNNQTGISNTFVGKDSGYQTTSSYNTFIGTGVSGGAGEQVTTGAKNTILGGFNGNQGGLDIRTLSNYIVLSDGDGTPRVYYDNVGVASGSGTMFRPYGAAPSNATTPANMPSSLGSANSCFYSLFVNNLTGYPYAYGPIFGWQETGNSGGYAYQIFHGFEGPNFYYRSGLASTGAWSGWYTFNITSVSDVRTKENIADSDSTLQLINNVRVVDFDYKADSGYSDGKRHKGVIAQEEQNNISEVVGHVGDPDNPDTLLDIKYERYVPYLIKAMQELSAQVTTLQAELAALKGQS